MGRYGVYNGWYGPMVTRYTGPMVTRYIGGLSQLPDVKMSCGKKSSKKLSNPNIIPFNLLKCPKKFLKNSSTSIFYKLSLF